MNQERRSESFARLAAQSPENELFRFNLAQALVSEHRMLDAVEHFRFCIQKKADWIAPRLQLGRLYLDLGKFPEGRLLLQEALRLAVDQQNEQSERELRELMALIP